jgi:hypothetical protein
MRDGGGALECRAVFFRSSSVTSATPMGFDIK